MKVLLLLMGGFIFSPTSFAKPPYLNELAVAYPDSRANSTTKCQTCHNNGKALNAYGKDYSEIIRRGNLERDEAYAKLGEIDSDGDGASNLEELMVGTNPGKVD